MTEGKCPNCGALLEGGKCAYCGYEAPKKAPENQVNNYTTVINNNYSAPQQEIGQRMQNGQQMQAGQQYVRPTVVCSLKSKNTALILCIFLGYLGIHRFYVGRTGSGILWLFTAGLFVFGWIADIVLIATGNFKDAQGLPLKMS